MLFCDSAQNLMRDQVRFDGQNKPTHVDDFFLKKKCFAFMDSFDRSRFDDTRGNIF